jgi:Fe2+ or Zn2+ uptake regulation protein
MTTNSTVTRLRLAGLRTTGPRLAIIAALESDRSHPSAEALLDNLRADHPALPPSTVSTTLEACARAGSRRRLHRGRVTAR